MEPLPSNPLEAVGDGDRDPLRLDGRPLFDPRPGFTESKETARRKVPEPTTSKLPILPPHDILEKFIVSLLTLKWGDIISFCSESSTLLGNALIC
jgi:hypothetical protein